MENRKSKLKHLKRYESFMNEELTSAAPAPVKPGIDTPTKPVQPTKPSVPRPSTNPDTGPKFEEEALKKLVARVKDSLDEKGEKIEDLIKKQ